MPLGTEVGLGQGDILLDGDPAPSLFSSVLAEWSPVSATAEILFVWQVFFPQRYSKYGYRSVLTNRTIAITEAGVLQARCPSCRPADNVNALKRKTLAYNGPAAVKGLVW